MTMTRCVLVVIALNVLASCAQTPESVKEQPSTGEMQTKESLFKRGHQLYLTQQFDSALSFLSRAVSLDSAYIDPWKDIAEIQYTLALLETGDKSPRKLEKSRAARSSYIRVERLGFKDSDVYERICELSVLLEDDKTFLAYAKKNVEKYPYERQYFNVGLAYFNAGDYQNVIRTQKEATQKFPASAFIGSFYRQLGRAYEKIDRDQTAERTFATGVKVVDECLVRMRKEARLSTTADVQRLQEDKIGMLLALKRIHQRYRANDKLRDVERQLTEAGYAK